MNNTKCLTKCRGCAPEFFSYAWLLPPLRTHLWPCSADAETSGQHASVFVCKVCSLAYFNEMPNLHWLHSKPPHYLVFHQHQSIFILGTLKYNMAKAGLRCKTVF